MLRNLMRLVPVPALVVAVLMAGCVDQSGLETNRLLGPETAQLAKGGKHDKEGKKEKKDRKNKGPKVKHHKKDGSLAYWSVVTGTLPEDERLLNDVAQVDGKKAAILSAAGHLLYIPKGAVDGPTTFRMQVFKKDVGDGTVMVGVELNATSNGRGPSVDVGAQGFLKPVTLYISSHYAAPGTDLAGAEILWLKSDTEAEPVPGLYGEESGTRVENWGGHEVFVAPLQHFSDYIIATPF